MSALRISLAAALAAVPLLVAAAPAGPIDLGGIQDVEELDLEDLLDPSSQVASRRATTLRRSPGLVTVIDREEIALSGARDLLDLLLLVPGLAPGVDVEGVVNLGVRGIWGHEGKILLLLDGHEVNEPLWGELFLGGSVPLDLVERVEIVRGPGSAVWGGHAELAVINVILRGARELGGVSAALSVGRSDRLPSHRAASASFGQTLPDLGGAEVVGSVHAGHSIRSDSTYTDVYGGRADLSTASDLDLLVARVAGRWKGLDARLLHLEQRTTTVDGYDVVLPAPLDVRHDSTFADLRWRLEPAPSVAITPRLAYKRQTPWNQPDPASPLSYYDKTAERFLGGLTLEWAPVAGLSLLGGGEAFQDRATAATPGLVAQERLFGDGGAVTFHDVAGFGEVHWASPVADLLAGARWERHSAFGGTFVPRLAVTRAWERFHWKLLVSRAFRAPSIENHNLNPDIRPERTTAWEVEAGVRPHPTVSVVASAYDLRISDPIVYFYDEETDTEGYRNFSRTGSRGVEAEVRLRLRRLKASASYSFYSALGRNRVPAYEVQGVPDVLLGFPSQKLAGRAAIELHRGVWVVPSAIWFGERFAQLSVDPAGRPVQGRLPPTLLLDGFVWWRNGLADRLAVGLGVSNVLDEPFAVPQPYDGGHAPLPARPREWLLRLSWNDGGP